MVVIGETSDNRKVKALLSLCWIMVTLCPAFPYKIIYAEQYYRLYHRHFYQDSDRAMENIVWLEKALEADFCNPLYALAEIDNKSEWRHYRYLFKMHVNLKLVEQFRQLANRYDKQVAYFYNAPWRSQNLESLGMAEELYRTALHYWQEARLWAAKLERSAHHLEGIQLWEDERYRILSGELDYREILEHDLKRLRRVQGEFERMDEQSY